jgi:uncharacterized protein YdaU (DUF1376 family)
MDEERPAFLLYVKDWLASTRGLTPAQKGAYIDLLCHAWLADGLPVDEEELRRIAAVENSEWSGIWAKLKHKWHGARGRLFNRRLEQVRKETLAFTDTARMLGKRGGVASAAARRLKYGSANPVHEPLQEPLHEGLHRTASRTAVKPSFKRSVDHENKDLFSIGSAGPVQPRRELTHIGEVLRQAGFLAKDRPTRQDEVAVTEQTRTDQPTEQTPTRRAQR